MKHLLIAILFISTFSLGQDMKTENILELGKYYSNFMFRNEPPKSTSKDLGKNYSKDLEPAVQFIKEVVKTKNKLLTPKFLTLPDTATLKVVYIIDALHQNPHIKEPLDPTELVNQLKSTEIPYIELVDEYYSTIFTSHANKNRPFDLSKVDFKMSNYNLNTDQMKGVFYLRCMDMCGTQIYGYMNIAKPPNTKKALEFIGRFPTFDGLKYYQYTDLHFKDFEMEMINDKAPESYKDYYIDKLYNTLLNHLLCVIKEEKNQETIENIILGSIIRDSSLYQHSSQKEVLEGVFEEE